MEQNAALAQGAINIAASEIGTKELTGHNDGTKVGFWQKWLANGASWMDKQAWCATFATWCVYTAASVLDIKPVIPKNGSSSDLYAFAVKNKLLTPPIPYCIGLIKGTGGTPGKTHHHTFLVQAVDTPSGVVHGIDGNWSNAVSKTTHAIKDCDFMVVV